MNAILTLSGVVGGVALSARSIRAAEVQQIVAPETPLLAYAGILTTRTDNNTGVVTLGAGHGVVTGTLVDVYWADSQGGRWNMTAVVAGNEVTIDGGSGSNLPALNSAVRIGQHIVIDVPDVIANNVESIALDASRETRIQPFSSVPAAQANLYFPAAGALIYSRYVKGQGPCYWLPGLTVATFHVSTGDAVFANTPIIALLLHA